MPRFFGEAPLAGWRNVADAVRAAGGAIFPQLWHTGVTRKPGSGPYPDAPVLSPSGVTPTGRTVAEPATAAQLAAVTAAYARAAAAARDAGFHGIELHGAHGYLLDEFHWPVTTHYDALIAEDPAELEAFLTPLAAAGVSLFHASTRRYWVPAFDGSDRTLAG